MPNILTSSLLTCGICSTLQCQHTKRGSVDARNMKGMMTFDRRIKKDSYFWYKANWSKEPVLYLTQRRNAVREKKETSITVYSNIGTPKVYLNGKELTGVRKGLQRQAGLTSPEAIEIGAYLIRRRGHTVLVDTGTGGANGVGGALLPIWRCSACALRKLTPSFSLTRTRTISAAC